MTLDIDERARRRKLVLKVVPLSMVTPVKQGQRLPIVLLSSVVFFLLLATAWYELIQQPSTFRLSPAAQRALDDSIIILHKRY
jgi:hypothetical protein